MILAPADGRFNASARLQHDPTAISRLFCAQACWSKVSCATRLNASAATVLSGRGATTPHGQWEQHQPVKCSSSAQIMCRVINTPSFVDFDGRMDFRERREELQMMRRSSET